MFDETYWTDREERLGEQRAALLDLLKTSLRMGHYKVALKRYFMLLARGMDVPLEQEEQIRALITRCRKPELEQMRRAAFEWALMVGGRNRFYFH